MKKLLLCLSCLVAFSFAKEKVEFVSPEKLPVVKEFMPAPAYPGSLGYSADSLYYLYGKSLRQTKGDSAILFAQNKLKAMLRFYGDVIGLSLNEKDFPEIAVLIRSVLKQSKPVTKAAKEKFARHRPYQDFKEPTLVPEEESPTNFTSYPSAHSTQAWLVSLVFVLLDPAHQNEILKLGYDIGQSRVIAGFHYQSDVDAARAIASAIFARLCAEPEFLNKVQKAKAEIEKKRNSR